MNSNAHIYLFKFDPKTEDQTVNGVHSYTVTLTSYIFLFLQFMDLRTRYTALVTLTTQHVKYINDALRRLEEEEV